jgi:ligand-binding sensor domain-containing protein
MHTRCFHLLACLFFCSNNFAQQYPFVYYTPKDGLVNSRVQGIKQDSKGRMYFTTYGGLSVYDGTRFVNYTQNNGLANELVNDIAELGPDSFLVATNTPVLNTLNKGKVAVFKTANNFCPLINRFLKSSDGKWYVAADDGLFVLEENRFRRLSLIDRNGNDLGLHLEGIIEWKNFFLIIPWRMDRTRLLLYDRQKNKLLNVYQKESLINAATDLQGRIWLSGTDGIKLIDTILLQQKGQIDFLPLPMKYKHVFDKKDGSIFFDTQGDTWLYGGNHVMKLSPDFDEQIFSSEQGLKASRLAGIFRDREGIVWIATDGNGVIKLNGVHVQLLSNFSVNRPGMISAMQQQNDTLWMFNVDNNTVYSLRHNQLQAYPLSGKKMNVSNLLVRDEKLYLGDADKIICIRNKNDIHSYKHPQTEMTADSIVTSFGTSIADAQGAIIQLYRKNGSTNYLCVLKEGKLYLMDYPISYATDQMTFDQQGRLWMVTRDNHLLVFTIHPQQPEKYIQLLKEYFKELPKMSARSIAVDKNNNVWIGTRYNGLYRLEFNGVRLKSYKQFTTRNGLTDNFIYNLHCDNNNTVWIGTQSGLDKIFWKDGRYLIGNVSKTYNFFQSVLKIITTKDNTVWSLTNEGNILKISPTSIGTPVPAPSLFLSSLHVNNREHHNFGNSFSYLENNLSFHVAAPYL